MDTNADLEITSHVRHLRTTPKICLRYMDGKGYFAVIVKFHTMSPMSHQMSHIEDYRFWIINIPRTDPYIIHPYVYITCVYEQV